MKVSIITSCYNSISTLEGTIQSVLSQTYPNIEFIIVDGLSNDGTIDLIKKYESKITTYISEKDAGFYDAINKGIKLSTGDVIGLLNSDDVFYDEFVVEKIVQSFQKDNELEAIYGNLLYVEKDKIDQVIRNWISKPFKKELFLEGWMPPHPTFYIKKECYQKFGVFNTSFKISADYELMLRMLYKHAIKAKYLPFYFVRMRVGGISNASFRNRIKANMEDRKAWKINGLKPRMLTFIKKPLSKIFQFFKKES